MPSKKTQTDDDPIRCTVCGEIKVQEDFPPRGKGGYYHQCKECRSSYQAHYRELNPEKKVLLAAALMQHYKDNNKEGPIVESKQCPMCKATKPASDFSFSKCSRTGLSAYCKPCDAAQQASRKHDIPITEVLRLRSQPCEICGSALALKIDHDHITGIVRGTLCHFCNVGIGNFRDSQLLLQAAINYLSPFQEKEYVA